MLFSKRHRDSIKKKILTISIDRNTRTRLLRCLQNHNFVLYLTSETGFNYEESGIEELLVPKFLDEQGWNHLIIWTGTEKKAKNITEFIEYGMPQHVLDAIELYSNILSEHKENVQSFQQEINRIFTEEKYAWRLLNGKLFKIDSSYLDEELLSETHILLQTHGFEGALDEFEQARSNYENRRYRDALTYANHSLESTLKNILGKKYATKKPGELIKGILTSGYIPPYLHQLKSFQELLEIPLTIRNNAGGHGSGEEKLIVPQEFAQLMLHLSGSLINFLIKTYIAQSQTDGPKEEPESYTELEPF